jgi:hypothetical protein
MLGGRVLFIVSACVIASAGIVTGAPAKGTAPAKGSGSSGSASGSGSATATGSGSGSAAGSGSGSAAGAGSGSANAGSAVQMTEDTPPADMNGVDENPDAPRGVGTEDQVVKVAPPPKPTGYPVEEVLRPITLPKFMLEIRLDPQLEAGGGTALPFEMTTTLRARFGITDKIQVGLAYNLAAVYADPTTMTRSYSLQYGRTLEVNATYLIQDWIGVRLGVPMYLNPAAVGLSLGAPIKFKLFGGKLALGGLDDLLEFALGDFPPLVYNEDYNAIAANTLATSNTSQASGVLRISVYAAYQLQREIAIIARLGEQDFLGGPSGGAGAGNDNSAATFLFGSVQWTPRPNIDVGATLGFYDLSQAGSFGPSAFVALRI